MLNQNFHLTAILLVTVELLTRERSRTLWVWTASLVAAVKEYFNWKFIVIGNVFDAMVTLYTSNLGANMYSVFYRYRKSY